MAPLRHFVLHHRPLAFWLVGLALLMRIIVPAGYMPAFSGNAISIELCSGYGPMQMAMPGMADHHGKQGDHGKGETPCGFSSVSAPSLPGVDPVLLALAILFIVATAFRAPPPSRINPSTNLRPPLRGPPATA